MVVGLHEELSSSVNGWVVTEWKSEYGIDTTQTERERERERERENIIFFSFLCLSNEVLCI